MNYTKQSIHKNVKVPAENVKFVHIIKYVKCAYLPETYDTFNTYHGLSMRVCRVSDLPRVSKLSPELFFARGLPARLECPVTANPPVTSVVWSKDDRVVAPLVPKDSGGINSARLTTDRDGSLLFQSVTTKDEGLYSCTPYSRLGVGQASRPVYLHVRGSSWFADWQTFIDDPGLGRQTEAQQKVCKISSDNF